MDMSSLFRCYLDYHEGGFISYLEDHAKADHVLVIHTFCTVLVALVSGEDPTLRW